MDLIIPIGVLLVLVLIGAPIAFALFASGIIGILLVSSPEVLFGMLQTVPFAEASHYGLLTIPMFILMAQFIARGGLAADIFNALTIWTGRLPGGQVIATIFGSAGLGAISGSSVAAASTMGKVAIPELKRSGYSPSFAVGSVAVAGTLAVMIPPSTALILYALLTETSIGSMLIAGIIPGIVTAIAFALVALVRTLQARRRGEAPRGARYSLAAKARATKTLWPFGVLIFGILYGIYSGIVSAIEASGLGAFLALVLLAALRRISIPQFIDAVRETVYLSSMIALIIVGATVFGYYLTLAGVPSLLVDSLTAAGLSKYPVLFILLGVFLFLGFFMDQIAILSLMVPLSFPIVTGLGFDAVWFGILIVALAEIGLVTPPLGLNVFVASAAGGEPVEVGFRGVWHYVAAQLGVIGLLITFPAMSLALI